MTRARELAATLLGFLVLWFTLDRSAALLGSTRGEFGLVVLALVLAVAIGCESVLSRRPPIEAAVMLGLRWPTSGALAMTLAISLVLVTYFPAFTAATGAQLHPLPGAGLLALGMLAQGGVAEEVVFRGFVFRRLRAGRTFWHAAWLAAAPFAAVHALLFLQLDWPIALASLLLAVSMSFPLAWLFERSNGSVLAPAILHGVTQVGIKLVDAGEHLAPLALGWMALCAAAPWIVFLLRPQSTEHASSSADASGAAR